MPAAVSAFPLYAIPNCQRQIHVMITLDAVHARSPIYSAARRLDAWRDACNSCTGADNLVRVGGIAYAIDLQPCTRIPDYEC